MVGRLRFTISKLNQARDAKQLSEMMTITFFTQILAVYKSSIIAANFGANIELDAYNFANNLATFFLTFVSSGITTVVIPAYVKKLDKRALDTFLTVVFLITGILLAFTFLLRGQLVDLMTSREPEFRVYVCGVMLLTILIQVFPAILGVTTAYFQYIRRFNLPKIVLLFSNLGIVLVLSLWKNFTLYEYLYVLLIGAILQFVIDLACAIKFGFRYRISFDLRNPRFRDISLIFLPTLFSTGIYKVNILIDSLLSSNIGTGQLTILTYSNMVVTMVNTMVVGNLIIYAYPKIVKKVTVSESEAQAGLGKYIVNFHRVVCLILVGFVCVGREFIGLLFEHGEFSAMAATTVYYCMCIYMVDQQNNIVRDLIYRFFFAHGDTKITVKNGMLTSAVNIITSIILVRIIGVFGIIVGTLIAGTVSLISIVMRFKKKYDFLFNIRSVLKEYLETIIISMITIVTVLLMKTILPTFHYIIAFLLYGLLCVVVYAIGLVLLKK